MIKSWDILVEDICSARKHARNDQLLSALFGMEQLARFVADSSLHQALFGWTSMFDLCIQQTRNEPYSGPYLRISPQSSGLVEFRYVDTAVERRQWRRLAPAECTTERLNTFLSQLHWIRGPVPANSPATEGKQNDLQ